MMKICNNCKKMVESAKSSCPYCGGHEFVPFEFSETPSSSTKSFISWSSTKLCIIALIVCMISVGIYTYLNSNEKSNSNNTVIQSVSPKITKEKESKQASVLTNYGDKRDEILKAFNLLFSDNSYAPIYEGVTHDPAIDTLTVYVNNNWDLLSKDVKLSFIKTCFVAWQTATTSRQIKTNTTSFSLEIINKSSGRKVASWGSVRGPVLYDE